MILIFSGKSFIDDPYIDSRYSWQTLKIWVSRHASFIPVRVDASLYSIFLCYSFHHLVDIRQTSTFFGIFLSAITSTSFLFKCNPFKNRWVAIVNVISLNLYFRILEAITDQIIIFELVYFVIRGAEFNHNCSLRHEYQCSLKTLQIMINGSFLSLDACLRILFITIFTIGLVFATIAFCLQLLTHAMHPIHCFFAAWFI